MNAADRNWFYWRETRPGLWLIAEPSHVYTWLVVGRERACLLDTGLGIGSIRAVVEEITSLPVVVVNTHYHFDHSGGNGEFDRILIHPAGADDARRATLDSTFRGYLDFIRTRDRGLGAFRTFDANYFGLLGPESDPRPFPDGIDEALLGSGAFTGEIQAVDEGSKIDLGGRILTVLHTPGHSPDAICLFDEHDGLLLTGDTFNVGLVYCHFTDSDLPTLQSTARRLAAMTEDIGYITAHHHPRIIAEPNLLATYSAGLDRIHELTPQPGTDIFGQTCQYVTYDHFTVTLPDPDHPSVV